MHYFSTLFNTVFTAIGICHTSYIARSGWNSSILTSLADSQHTSMTNTYCCEYSIKTPDDGQ